MYLSTNMLSMFFLSVFTPLIAHSIIIRFQYGDSLAFTLVIVHIFVAVDVSEFSLPC